MAHSYSVAALVAAHTAIRDLLDSADPSPGVLDIYDNSGTPVLLGTIELDLPSGTINGTTGQLTLVQGAREESAPASGTAAFGVFKAGDGTPVLTLDCQAGTEPVSGALVLNTLVVVAGGPIELVSATIG